MKVGVICSCFTIACMPCTKPPTLQDWFSLEPIIFPRPNKKVQTYGQVLIVKLEEDEEIYL
jgi:hypothetical protein